VRQEKSLDQYSRLQNTLTVVLYGASMIGIVAWLWPPPMGLDQASKDGLVESVDERFRKAADEAIAKCIELYGSKGCDTAFADTFGFAALVQLTARLTKDYPEGFFIQASNGESTSVVYAQEQIIIREPVHLRGARKPSARLLPDRVDLILPSLYFPRAAVVVEDSSVIVRRMKGPQLLGFQPVRRYDIYGEILKDEDAGVVWAVGFRERE